ncbi:MAG: hypothetical protein Kow0074_16440 [Candidatus Zixiibacteriota bacterium]
MMSKAYSYEGGILSDAIRQTFDRRNTKIPVSVPAGLSDDFSGNTIRLGMWSTFWSRVEAEGELPALRTVVDDVRGFVLEPMFAAGQGISFDRNWSPGGPWA